MNFSINVKNTDGRDKNKNTRSTARGSRIFIFLFVIPVYPWLLNILKGTNHWHLSFLTMRRVGACIGIIMFPASWWVNEQKLLSIVFVKWWRQSKKKRTEALASALFDYATRRGVHWKYYVSGFIVGERAKTIKYRFCEVMSLKQGKKDKSLGFCPFRLCDGSGRALE